MSASNAKVEKGLPIYWDTSASWRNSVRVAPDAYRKDIRLYQNTRQLVGSTAYAKGGVDPAFPYQGRSTFIYDMSWVSTFGSGTGNVAIYEEDPKVTSSRVLKATIQKWNILHVTTVVGQNQEFRNGFEGERGKRLIVALENSAAQSVVRLGVTGELQRKLN